MPDNNSYIVAAYAVTWITLLGFALRLHAVARRARERYADASLGKETEES
jgi:hypothetical protein